MNDIKLFCIKENNVVEMRTHHFSLENELQNIIENNLETFLGIKLLARQYGTGRIQKGYIDTLGIDENHCPVIVEYKRRSNENVITQGLFYLDWLLDHQGDFTLLVREKYGPELSSQIEFSSPRVVCIASSFNRFDERAINQIGKSVELVRYKFYGGEYLMLEMINNTYSTSIQEFSAKNTTDDHLLPGMPPQMRTRIKSMSSETENLYFDLIYFAESLGDDVNIRFLKHYIALTRIRNFTCIQPAKNNLKLWLNLDPSAIEFENGFGRDVSTVGHHATGDIEIDINNNADLTRVKPYIEMAYAQN